jgi:hypothetical protein
MKKIILSLVFVLATGMSFINATATNDEILPTTKEAIEVVEEFGCASGCNSLAREGALVLSSNHEDRGEGSELMDRYSELYFHCYTTTF